MKAIILSSMIALLSISSVFATESSEYATKVGIQAIARTVVEKKLVDAEAQSVLKLALETGRAEFGSMECERGLGSDYCTIEVSTLDDESTDEAEETLYYLSVRLIQGKVYSASWELIAG